MVLLTDHGPEVLTPFQSTLESLTVGVKEMTQTKVHERKPSFRPFQPRPFMFATGIENSYPTIALPNERLSPDRALLRR